jgi:hypothetical protein
MLKFECQTCNVCYDVEDSLTGKVLRCRGCAELVRVLAPKARVRPAPPPAPVQPSGDDQAWYYGFLETYAIVLVFAGILAGFLVLVLATGYGLTEGGALVALVGLVGGVLIALSGVLAYAVLLLLVDIGRSLRKMRPDGREERAGAREA